MAAEHIKRENRQKQTLVAVPDKELCNGLQQKAHKQININMNGAATKTGGEFNKFGHKAATTARMMQEEKACRGVGNMINTIL